MEGYLQYCGGDSSSTCGEIGFSTVGDTFSTVELFNTVGDNISTVGVASVLWRVFSTLEG